MKVISYLTLSKFHVEYLAKLRGSVHSSPEEFENLALFLRLDLPSTLIRQEHAALFLRLKTFDAVLE